MSMKIVKISNYKPRYPNQAKKEQHSTIFIFHRNHGFFYTTQK